MSTPPPLSEVTYSEAIRLALEDAMTLDESIVLLGQDISAGFPFGATRGLVELFGEERVRDTPISEAAGMGCAIGAAMMGTRTVLEVDFAGFLLLGLDQLVNNAAKLRYMSGGQLRVPLVLRVGQGPLGAFAAQHSQSQHAWLTGVPGLGLCVPSSPQDAYDLLRWALRRRDPVVFAEDMRLYRVRGPLKRETSPPPAGERHLTGEGEPAGESEPPREGETTGDDEPAGEDKPRARVIRPGSDASIVCFGFGTTLALEASARLALEGIELEVVDLRLLSPLDQQTIGASARHTGRVLCLGDDPLLGGITATLAAVVDEQAHGELSAPVARLGARRLPTPFGSAESFVYPSVESVVTGVCRLLAWKGRPHHPEGKAVEPRIGPPPEGTTGPRPKEAPEPEIAHGELRMG